MIGDGPVARGFADGHQVGFERLLPRVTWRGDLAVASLPAGQNISTCSDISPSNQHLAALKIVFSPNTAG